MRVFAAAAVIAAVLATTVPLSAEPGQGRPVVAELFTSEGCSSCPPAEALLATLARRDPDVLALAFHVTYWDRLGWPDRFALPAATARQRAYAARMGLESVYTPQLVVDGTRDVVGSDQGAVQAALRSAAAVRPPAVALHIARTGDGVTVAVGGGSGRGDVVLIGYDGWHETHIARGENAGRIIAEANVVRAIRPLRAWTGTALRIAAPAVPGEHLAVLLQAQDGRILGAASLP